MTGTTAPAAGTARTDSTRTLVRTALLLLAAAKAMVGVWAQFLPESFYQDFPFGQGWVAMLPPYNEHLARDAGGLSLSLVVVLVAAAVRVDRWTSRVAALAMAVFAVPHAIFHALHLEHMSTADAVSQTVGTVLLCVLALAVWVLAGRLPQRAGQPGTEVPG